MNQPFTNIQQEANDLKQSIKTAILSFKNNTGILPNVSWSYTTERIKSCITPVLVGISVEVQIPVGDENIIMKLNLDQPTP